MGDWWRDRPWRMIQTNLREIDMRDISAARVVADLKAFAANVLMINAAGIIASYPTDLPFHFQSEYLTGGGQLLHMVNGSGHFGTSFFAPVVMCGLKVNLPQPSAPKSVKALVLQQQCEHAWKDGVLTIELPSLELFEALLIE